MNAFHLNSDYAHIHIGFIYIGWHNNARPPIHNNDCGDESFGLGIGNFYVGCYTDGKWCAGFLNEYGCLD